MAAAFSLVESLTSLTFVPLFLLFKSLDNQRHKCAPLSPRIECRECERNLRRRGGPLGSRDHAIDDNSRARLESRIRGGVYPSSRCCTVIKLN